MTTMVLDDIEAPDFDQDRFDTGAFDGILEVVDRDGDTKLMWDRNNPDEVKLIAKTIKRGRKLGMLPYRVQADDVTKGEQMTEFDPTAERVILSPALQGG